MTKRAIPSLSALQAFDAAARLLSFTRAAEELCLTQSAISRQIQSLEEATGTALFDRAGNRLALTEAGQGYHAEIAPLLDGLRNATLRLMAYKGSGGTLRLAVLPTLGMKWLVPRLPSFVRAHPEIQVELNTRTTPVDWQAEHFDAAIQHGRPAVSGLAAIRLMGEELVVVASRDLAAAGEVALDRVPLLQQITRPEGWARWFDARGIAHPDPHAGPRFEQFSHVIQAAIAGLGLALVPRFLVEDELGLGQLRIVGPGPAAMGDAYYLVHPERKRHDPAIVAFGAWLAREARAFDAGTGRSRSSRTAVGRSTRGST